ncbi:flagellar basal body rod protein FlgB [Pusillimonas sp. CC-YST705]|uniref:Flagellar basal body rod protein FlgB n=1 Tax=Mesopusillimonas faecipullorum TaxID=2755040 RepID=A0ABS8C9X5_9BURK|nr:flagellar basal body rod protein FlgB [Mesopusillimonas faecipullorum]MCB5362813.1 flagellar basal body rod protein FlgB [Mesopusillimonas faecipullorum]
MTDPISRDLDFFQNAISLRQQRQEVLATNIANADTPNYKARDFDFSQALLKAGGGSSSSSLPLARTSDRHLPGVAGAGAAVPLQYRQAVQPSLDGNTVDMDVERVQFADNTSRYQADLTLISQRLKSINAALAQ